MTSPHQIIRGLKVISATGSGAEDWSQAVKLEKAPIRKLPEAGDAPIFPLTAVAQERLQVLEEDPRFASLDRVTQLALCVAHDTLATLQPHDDVGCISIGSSRGPTHALERAVGGFIARCGVHPLTSPVTTAGNLASSVAQSYLAGGDSRPTRAAAISTSMTCSSAFHSLMVASSFLRAGFATVALFGGSESCLTPFTIAQLTALRLYSNDPGAWPCQPFGADRGSSNTVVLGEGAGTALLLPDRGEYKPSDLVLLGIGWALEQSPSVTGISLDGAALQNSMRMAAARLDGRAVDLVIAHAPGSLKGDEAELFAIREVFGDVAICTTKHLTGHTYGASGMVSLSMAQGLLTGDCQWSGMPYSSSTGSPSPHPQPRTIAINTAGFGGNSVTVIVGSPSR